MASKKTLEHYLRQLRLIEEHREKWCEENVRRHYRDLMKDLNEFLGVQYAALAKDDKLTYEILHEKASYARFLEEVEMRINKFSPEAAQEIRNTVQLTYEKAYEGMVTAVNQYSDYKDLKLNLTGLRATTPDVIKNVVKNKHMEQALEKNHKSLIYNIRQQIGIGLSQGDRMSTMAKRLSTQVEGGYKKAMLISRTEVHRAREAGYQDSSERLSQVLKDNNSDYVMVKTWKTMQDMSVRPYRMKGKKGKKTFVKGKGPDHIKMHGKTILVEEEFELDPGVTARCPGESGVAGHDCNCRCQLSRDLMTKAEYEKLSGKKLNEDYKVAQYEAQEKVLLDEKKHLEADKAKLEQRKQNLESYEYDGIWKDKVTPADYELKKNSIQAKRDYYNDDILNAQNRTGKYANSNWYSDNDLNTIIMKDKEYLKQLDDFEKQGKTYLKLKKQIADIDSKLPDIDDEVKEIRQKLMKAKGIDPDKMQDEIDDIVNQINGLSKKPNNVTDLYNVKLPGMYTGEDYFKNPGAKQYLDSSYDMFKKQKINGTLDSWNEPSYEELKEFFEQLHNIQSGPADTKALKKLQKELKDKQDELDKIKKRYGLEDDKFSQKRKDNALWFTNQNGGADAADKAYRSKAGEVWRKATRAQKNSAYEYTQSYHKYNEPLRGIEYGTNKFLGVGNIDLDDIGVSTGYGFKKGEVKKLIDNLTDYINESTYDQDIWLNRGCRRSGMDKFFNIDPSDFDLSEKELAAKLLGTTPTEYGFMSTGTAKGSGFGGDIKLNIYAPKGTQMAYVEPFSAFGHGAGKSWDGITTQSSIGYEAEMLLQRNTQFRVIKVEKSGSQWYIDMEVIGQRR